jgi:hypothetical protein
MMRACAISALLVGASACAIQPGEADPEPAGSSAADPAGSEEQVGEAKEEMQSTCTKTPAGHIFCCFWTDSGSYIGCDD